MKRLCCYIVLLGCFSFLACATTSSRVDDGGGVSNASLNDIKDVQSPDPTTVIKSSEQILDDSVNSNMSKMQGKNMKQQMSQRMLQNMSRATKDSARVSGFNSEGNLSATPMPGGGTMSDVMPGNDSTPVSSKIPGMSESKMPAMPGNNIPSSAPGSIMQGGKVGGMGGGPPQF